ncbi:serine/threonine-protein kinase [Kitasatospora sp. DSM 101779]|uniref:serine/threonine-protein kinase n=1 Tax=Kitasatospora sp. DSM 101779 TaxID=2853165 RepID=UPI0021DB0E35|nr:protein kinase [Kitasatospora sp. DSM 101779]
MNTGGPETRLIDGRFELLQRLGGGGMGLVWRARDNALEREVALKEVRPPDPAMLAGDPIAAQELRERVLREARALARLQHPNVVIIHHIVDTPDQPHPWLVMELVSGGSLADRLVQGPLSVPEAARIGRGVLAALRAAHAAGIQHRDVKPGNVLLRTDGTPVLTDFGIAAMQDATALTATGSLIGSPEYIAPERIRGGDGDASSDLWSLGMMLYVAIEGHHPLRRGTTLATLAAVLDEPLPPPVRGAQLGPLLGALLSRDPALRPDAEMLDRLLAAAEQGEPAAGPAAWAPTVKETFKQPGPPESTSGSTAQPVFGTPTGAPAGYGVPAVPGAFGAPAAGYGYPQPSTGPVAGYGHPQPPVGGYGFPQGQPPVPTGPNGGGYGFPQSPTGDMGGYGHPQSPTGPTSSWTPQNGHPNRPVSSGGRGRTVLLSVSVASAALAGALVWNAVQDDKGGTSSNVTSTGTGGTTAGGTTAGGTTGSTGTGSPAATASKAGGKNAAPKDLLTTEGVRAVVDAIKPAAGTSMINELTVYPEYAIAESPKTDNPKLYDRIDYRNGHTSKTPGGSVIGDDKPVDLNGYDWSVIPGLLQKAQQELNVPNPKSRYLIIGPDMFDGTPTIRVYFSDDYGSGYLSADTKGNVIKSYPHD